MFVFTNVNEKMQIFRATGNVLSKQNMSYVLIISAIEFCNNLDLSLIVICYFYLTYVCIKLHTYVNINY